jgi:hypothetical protein
MICINDDIIQKYVDGEATAQEVSFIQNHIASCNKCVIRIENQRRLSTYVKKAIKLLSIDIIEVPKFEIPSKNIRKHFLTPKRLYYTIAAACVLLFAIVITQKKEIKNDNEIKIDIRSIMDVDANRTVSQLPLVISIIDSKGNISEYIVN